MPSSKVPAARGLLALAFALLLSLHGGAGELTPPGAPAPTMKSLEEIYGQAAQLNAAAGGGNALLMFPYVLERAGSISDTQYTFDTTFDLVLTKPYRGAGLKSEKVIEPVSVYLYLFNNSGQIATASGGAPIANPAVFTLDETHPKASILLENLIVNAGGFPSSIFLGYAVFAVSSGDWNDVAMKGTLSHSHTGPGDLSITPLTATRVPDPAVAPIKSAAPPAQDKQ